MVFLGSTTIGCSTTSIPFLSETHTSASALQALGHHQALLLERFLSGVEIFLLPRVHYLDQAYTLFLFSATSLAHRFEKGLFEIIGGQATNGTYLAASSHLTLQ